MDDRISDDSSVFTGSFTQQEPIPEAGIEAAVRVMRHGRLHRYNTLEDEAGETALLEQEFAAATGARFCLAVASGGYALACALRALGVAPGQPVLTNGFTLAPVPGAVAAVGAVPVFVETTAGLTIDMDHLRDRIAASGARVLLLSHMRGHICEMERLMDICDKARVTVVEDCAHTMGADWNGAPSGRFGALGCYSAQTYKHINSGEGGFLVGDDPEVMARAVMLSGSYMFHDRHPAGPAAAAYQRIRFETPNMSGRMDNLRAAILRPQIADLPRRRAEWATLYRAVEEGLAGVEGLSLILRDGREGFVGSSFQFLLPGWDGERIARLVAACAVRGVVLKWFGAAEPQGYTSRHDSWRYAPAQELPRTDKVLSALLDFRLPLTFSSDDCTLIARIIASEVARHAA
ncbi:aminotransferase [Brevirhabdus pacifica]|uniref:Aminotransferase n=1 Tax=Brevirhabdus pacifica TaxID=1267768 RepID=A0A1U7DKQ4_9RHOB|nr:aminotransferase class I/II-fold pyridoxal phosphate-dependent enzyme [Brevirhabdus pacifica]APX90597.1 aminotransferase [Brevirhabdus pacifica]OWU78407.1 aminotransferase [Loktanella sp. 22II-4b]PJJ85266.1 dTDP-4-amino-4,6-dideoxygalactose transaminase [Brevirhabdus pacifica]